MALAAMETLDAEKLYETVTSRHISMCGMLPAVIVFSIIGVLAIIASLWSAMMWWP